MGTRMEIFRISESNSMSGLTTSESLRIYAPTLLKRWMLTLTPRTIRPLITILIHLARMKNKLLKTRNNSDEI